MGWSVGKGWRVEISTVHACIFDGRWVGCLVSGMKKEITLYHEWICKVREQSKQAVIYGGWGQQLYFFRIDDLLGEEGVRAEQNLMAYDVEKSMDMCIKMSPL
jgi:hypothetical protein